MIMVKIKRERGFQVERVLVVGISGGGQNSKSQPEDAQTNQSKAIPRISNLPTPTTS
jgi:hypothetical protein